MQGELRRYFPVKDVENELENIGFWEWMICPFYR
jgi:hypothetical protein